MPFYRLDIREILRMINGAGSVLEFTLRVS